MFYIVPAWTNDIQELNQDPLKNLTNVLTGGGKKTKLVFLNFLPNLRYILHVNQMTDSDFWNVWDEILDIKREDGMPLGPEALVFPKGVRIVPALGGFNALLENKRYANILCNRQGYIEKVEFLAPNAKYTDFYDDRGFKVSTEFYEGAKLVKQEWFNEEGRCVVRYEPNQAMPVQILTNLARFDKDGYATLEDLLLEFTLKFLKREFDRKQDQIVASTKPVIRTLMLELQKRNQVTYLLDYEGKLKLNDLQDLLPQIQGSRKFIISNYVVFKQVQSNVDVHYRRHLELGYPYGTDMRLGNSNEEKKLNIYWYVGPTTEKKVYEEALDVLIDYYFENKDIGLNCSVSNVDLRYDIFLKFTARLTEKYSFLDLKEDRPLLVDIIYRQNYGKSLDKLLTQAKRRAYKSLDKKPYLDGFYLFEEEPEVEEPDSEKEQIDWDLFVEDISNLAVWYLPAEYQMFDDLMRARVMLDFGKPYDTRMQFNAISVGLPQIIKEESPFVVSRENGWVVNSKHSLRQGLDYYLQELGNWNIALVNTVKYMEKLSIKRQADWWERSLYEK